MCAQVELSAEDAAVVTRCVYVCMYHFYVCVCVCVSFLYIYQRLVRALVRHAVCSTHAASASSHAWIVC